MVSMNLPIEVEYATYILIDCEFTRMLWDPLFLYSNEIEKLDRNNSIYRLVYKRLPILTTPWYDHVVFTYVVQFRVLPVISVFIVILIVTKTPIPFMSCSPPRHILPVLHLQVVFVVLFVLLIPFCDCRSWIPH